MMSLVVYVIILIVIRNKCSSLKSENNGNKPRWYDIDSNASVEDILSCFNSISKTELCGITSHAPNNALINKEGILVPMI